MLAFSDVDSVESWTLEGSADRMRAEFSDWEPKWVKGRRNVLSMLIIACRLQKILSLVQSTYKWKLMDRAPLQTWVHPSGRLLLLGDACHPMLVSLDVTEKGAGILKRNDLAIQSSRSSNGRKCSFRGNK